MDIGFKTSLNEYFVCLFLSFAHLICLLICNHICKIPRGHEPSLTSGMGVLKSRKNMKALEHLISFIDSVPLPVRDTATLDGSKVWILDR